MFTVEIKNDAVTSGLTELGAKMGDMSPLMGQIAKYMMMSTKERFKKGVSPDGAKWAPKSPTTLARYGARKSNRVDIRPLFGPSGMLSSQIFPDHTANQAEIGSNLIYAAAMHFGAAKGAFGSMSNGSPIPWGNIPARPFFGISAEDEDNLLALIADYIAVSAAS